MEAKEVLDKIKAFIASEKWSLGSCGTYNYGPTVDTEEQAREEGDVDGRLSLLEDLGYELARIEKELNE